MLKEIPLIATIIVHAALLELVKLTAIVLFSQGVEKCLYDEPLNCSDDTVITVLLQDAVLQC